jgi:UDPglucose 6-dehydrogenase
VQFITFINEMADLAEEVGADVQDVARGIGLDNRIGSKFLHAGPGFGGSCFPKDTRALLNSRSGGIPAHRRGSYCCERYSQARHGTKVSAAFGESLRGKTIAVLGLTFKPMTDDMREAPSILWSPRCKTWARWCALFILRGWSKRRRFFPM